MAITSIQINVGTSGTLLDARSVTAGRLRTVGAIGDPTNDDVASVVAASTAAPATLPALVVIPRADSVNANGQANMAGSTPVAIASDQSSIPMKGDILHDAADNTGAGPVKVGGQARTTMPASVADADRANFITDKLGRQLVTTVTREIQISAAAACDNTTTEQDLRAAQGTGIFADLVGLWLTNTDIAGTEVQIRDIKGAGTLFTFYAPAQQTIPIIVPGGGFVIEQGTANNIWGIKSVTAVTNLKAVAIFKLDR